MAPNGSSIVQVEWARVTYYHVELARHAVIYAEGAAAESYLEPATAALSRMPRARR